MFWDYKFVVINYKNANLTATRLIYRTSLIKI